MFGKVYHGLYYPCSDFYLFDNSRSQKKLEKKNTLQVVGCFSNPIFIN